VLLNTGLLFSCRPFSSLLFYRATACNATHGIAVAILSVRPSVTCLDCDKTIWCTAYILIAHERAITLLFRQHNTGWWMSLLSEICAQSDPLPSKRADIDRFLFITSQPQEIAKKVQLWRTGSRPRAFERAIDVVRTLPASPPNGGSKRDVFVKNQSQRKNQKSKSTSIK